MKVSYETKDIEKTTASVMIVPGEVHKQNGVLQSLFRLTGGSLTSQIKAEGYTGKRGTVLEWSGRCDNRNIKRIVLVGKVALEDAAEVQRAIATGIKIAVRRKTDRVCVALNQPPDKAVLNTTLAFYLSTYHFDKYKSAANPFIPQIGRILVDDEASSAGNMRRLIRTGSTLAAAVCNCRDMVNEPANALGVDDFITLAKSTPDLSVKVVTTAQLKKIGARLLLAVGQGAASDPKMLVLRYQPQKKKRIALVGKGIVYDSGGMSLKPASSMENMKTDMAGGAVVYNVMAALPTIKPKVGVDAYIPLAENSIGKAAVRPGDIVQSLQGSTVEINNTDAEGRLILADAIAHAIQSKPELLIDFATLTGSCSVALGRNRAALYSNNDELGQHLLDAAQDTGELVWPMPLAKELKTELRSDIADLKNSGSRWGGSISAALFLQHFVEDTPWAHLDIAGPARNTKHSHLCPKGGTGFGVLTALSFISHYK